MKIVKVWLSIVLLFCIGLSGNCQKNTFDLKCKFEVIKETSLPYERVLTDKGQRNPSYGLVADKEIPCSLLFEYMDFGGTIKTTWTSGGSIFRLFKPESSEFVLVVAKIGVSECTKHLLITYDKEGKMIDYIEVEIGFVRRGEYTSSKHWRIDKNLQIQVCQVKPISSEPILFFDKYYQLDSMQGQRIDTYYKIEKSGKFQQVKQVKYKPREYDCTFFKSKNIWNSGDVALEK